MKNTTKIVHRLKMAATDLERLKQDSVSAGLSPMDALHIEEAALLLEHLVGRLTRVAGNSVVLCPHIVSSQTPASLNTV